MISRYPLRPLGEVLRLDVDQATVQLDADYRLAGVYSFGRGLFGRGPLQGSATGYRMLNRLHEGQLVLSRLKAFEGALTVVPPRFDGWFLSPEFPTFSCIPGQALPAWIDYLCRWPSLWEQLARSSRGVGARRERVHPDRFLSIEVPLPDPGEQARVAVELDAVARASVRIESALSGRPDVVQLLPRLIDGLCSSVPYAEVPVGQLIEFAGRPIHSSEAERAGLDFVGLEHVEPHTGVALGCSNPGAAHGPKKLFDAGDLLYPRLRPYQNKVWLADRAGVCSTDQLVLRPNDAEQGPVLAVALRSQLVLNQAIGLTSSLQLPRLRQASFTGVLIRVPTDPEPWLRAAGKITCTAREARRAADHAKEVARSYLPSALNQAFAGAM